MKFSEEFKNLCYDSLFCILLLFIPSSIRIPNIITISLILFFLIDYKRSFKLDFKKLIQPHYLIFCFLMLYLFLKAIFTNTVFENNYTLFLIVLALPFLFLKVNNPTKIMVAFIGSVLFRIAIAGYNVSKYYFEHKNLNFFEGEIINNLLQIERPYLGFLCVISTVILLWLTTIYHKIRYVLFFLAFLNIVFLSVISARLSIISIVLICVLYLIFYFNLSILKKVQIFSILLLTSSIILFFNSNLRKRLFISSDIEQSIEKFKHHEPRFIIWDCAYSIATQKEFNILFGLNSKKELENQYSYWFDKKMTNKHRANFFIQSKLNSHNQFIGTYLTSGLLGLMLLFGFLFFQWINYKENFYKTSLTLSLFFFFIFEMVLERQLGVYIFTFVICLLTLTSFGLVNNNKN